MSTSARRVLTSFGVAFLLALVVVSGGIAGGWATITLDEWPEQVTAGSPLEIGFTVRQHGNEPMRGLTPTVTIKNSETGEQQIFRAEPEGETGHYSASLAFPSGGEWEWSIQAFSMDQPMPSLQVAAGGPVAGEIQSPVQPAPFSIRALLGLPALVVLAGLLGAGAGTYFFVRRRARWAPVIIAAGLLVSSAGFISARAEEKPVEATQSSAAVQLGQKLFVAKGCVTCHTHAGAPNRGNISTDVGPNLTEYSASPDYLRVWLKDPQAVKPNNTEMPNLELKESEIEALIAFLN
jgi:mono/diheme cytochrome c family protein